MASKFVCSMNLEMDFICAICSETFSHSKDLEKHGLIHHRGKSLFKCVKCAESFRYWLGKHGLKSHLETHAVTGAEFVNDNVDLDPENFIVEADPLSVDGDIEFCELVCGDCGIQYPDSISYESHCKTHNSREPFKCVECFLRFQKCANLEEHRASHLLVKLHNCQECGKDFSFKWSLLMHSKIHGQSPLYHCSKCGLEFLHSDFLSSHEQLHVSFDQVAEVDLKPDLKDVKLLLCKFHFDQVIPCPVCDEERNGSCSKSISPSLLECEDCELQFATKDDLTHHMQLHRHPQAFRCEECEKAFASYIGLREHVNANHSDVEVHWCEDCGGSGYANISSSMESSRMEDHEDWSSCADNVEVVQHMSDDSCHDSSSVGDLAIESMLVKKDTIKKNFNMAGLESKQKGIQEKINEQTSSVKSRIRKKGITKEPTDKNMSEVLKLKRCFDFKVKRTSQHHPKRKGC